MPSADRRARDEENRALRTWAAAEGIELPRGRIPDEIREQFHAAGGMTLVATLEAEAAAADATPPGPVPGPAFLFPPPPPDDVPPPPGSPPSSGGGRGGGSSSSKPAGGKKSPLAQVQSDLAGAFKVLGAGAMYMSPIAGSCIIDDSDPVSVEIVRLGEQYPEFGEWLVKASQVAPPLKLAKYGGRWLVAAAADRGRVAVDSMPARVFGVHDKALELAANGVINISEAPAEPAREAAPAA